MLFAATSVKQVKQGTVLQPKLGEVWRSPFSGLQWLPNAVQAEALVPFSPPANRSRVSIGRSDEVAYEWCVNSLEIVSGSARHGVQANSREVVTLTRTERLSRLMHLLPDLRLHFGRKSLQDR
jgi:hypothetical protein